MKSKSTVIIIAVFIALFIAPITVAYTPNVGDHFSYHEIAYLGSGTGDYAGYTEQATYNGEESITGINADGSVSAHYSYSYTWSNSSGTTETGNPSGDFAFSPTTFLYTDGTDDQTGYVNPNIWFFMDKSIPEGGTFTLLNTEMTVVSRNYAYHLPSENKNVNVIYAQGISGYQRNDIYGQFAATYSWKTYFDPSTGYIVGYSYEEHDTDLSGTGFTYTETLYVDSTSYPLTTLAPGAETPTPAVSIPAFVTPGPFQSTGFIIGIAILFFFILVIIVIAILAIASSGRSRRSLPQHSYQQSPPPPGPPPENFDLTPNQHLVHQIVIQEVVKVKCRYCGALIDSTVETCPICGAPRT